jgi:hypothetical protein
VCAQNLSPADFKALAPGVSWWYNWHFEPDAVPPAGGPEFVPMLWGDAAGSWDGLERSLKTGRRPRIILGLNEPNLKSQSNLDPAVAAKAWKRLKALADSRGIPLVGPQVAIGSAPNDSVNGWEPGWKRMETYTYMIPYLDAFFGRLGSGYAPALAVHSYGNAGELKWAVGELAKRYGGPVWVTEFNEYKAADEDAQITYMKQAVDFMEKSPDVAGYAWFMARIPGMPLYSLLEREPGRLTRLGEVYVSLPAHAAGR